jgi:SAM-dependent methyltransferase
MGAVYDEIGSSYSELRRADPRIASQLERALGDAASIVNVGAGTGSYEPAGRRVIAVEPSNVMIGQRPADAAPVVQAGAEQLPFADHTFEAAMAVLSLHHWTDPERGLAEMRRVADRIVVLSFDAAVHNEFWLIREYLPAAGRVESSHPPPVEAITAAIASAFEAIRVEVVPVPHDCADGFGWAYWRRPERYLDAAARAGSSMLAGLRPADLHAGLARLANDLESGRWHDRHRDLLERCEIDGGFRLIVADSAHRV